MGREGIVKVGRSDKLSVGSEPASWRRVFLLPAAVAPCGFEPVRSDGQRGRTKDRPCYPQLKDFGATFGRGGEAVSPPWYRRLFR